MLTRRNRFSGRPGRAANFLLFLSPHGTFSSFDGQNKPTRVSAWQRRYIRGGRAHESESRHCGDECELLGTIPRTVWPHVMIARAGEFREEGSDEPSPPTALPTRIFPLIGCSARSRKRQARNKTPACSAKKRQAEVLKFKRNTGKSKGSRRIIP